MVAEIYPRMTSLIKNSKWRRDLLKGCINCICDVIRWSDLILCSLLAGSLWVFLSRKTPNKRGVRDRRGHLGRTRKIGLGRVTKRGGGDGARREQGECDSPPYPVSLVMHSISANKIIGLWQAINHVL